MSNYIQCTLCKGPGHPVAGWACIMYEDSLALPDLFSNRQHR